MAEFIKKADGEEFVISGYEKECSAKVTHQRSGRYATVFPGPEGQQRFVYQLDSGLGWQASTVQGAIDGACSKIIEVLKRPSREDACEEIHQYLKENADE